MKQIIIILTLLALFGNAYSQSKLDNLTENPSKKDGHFVGKTGDAITSDPYMASYEVAFDFWAMFNEPVYMFKFKWDMKSSAHSNTVKINDAYRRFGDYPEVWEKMKKQLVPLTDLSDSKLLTVSLKIALRKGGTTIANITHEAKIDLPDPAGKWNTLAVPGSTDWIKAFAPPGGHQALRVAGDVSLENNDKLQALYRSGDNKAYGKFLQSLFKQADNIQVKAVNISNIRWAVSGYEYAIKEIIKEKNIEKSSENEGPESYEDDFWDTAGDIGKSDFWNTTGYNEQEVSDTGIQRADEVFYKIKDYKDKSNLAKAKNLYQAAIAKQKSEYADSQIAKINKIMNYKPMVLGRIDIFYDKDKRAYGLKSKDDNTILVSAKFNRIIPTKDSSMYLGQIDKAIEVYDYKCEKIYSNIYQGNIMVKVCNNVYAVIEGIKTETINNKWYVNISDTHVINSDGFLKVFKTAELDKISDYSIKLTYDDRHLSYEERQRRKREEERQEKEQEERERNWSREARSKFDSYIASGYKNTSKICDYVK